MRAGQGVSRKAPPAAPVEDGPVTAALSGVAAGICGTVDDGVESPGGRPSPGISAARAGSARGGALAQLGVLAAKKATSGKHATVRSSVKISLRVVNQLVNLGGHCPLHVLDGTRPIKNHDSSGIY